MTLSQKILWTALEEYHSRLAFTCMYVGMFMCTHAHVNMQTHIINKERKSDVGKKEESGIFDTQNGVYT